MGISGIDLDQEKAAVCRKRRAFPAFQNMILSAAEHNGSSECFSSVRFARF
jgi:hypothetical protein